MAEVTAQNNNAEGYAGFVRVEGIPPTQPLPAAAAVPNQNPQAQAAAEEKAKAAASEAFRKSAADKKAKEKEAKAAAKAAADEAEQIELKKKKDVERRREHAEMVATHPAAQYLRSSYDPGLLFETTGSPITSMTTDVKNGRTTYHLGWGDKFVEGKTQDGQAILGKFGRPWIGSIRFSQTELNGMAAHVVHSKAGAIRFVGIDKDDLNNARFAVARANIMSMLGHQKMGVGGQPSFVRVVDQTIADQMKAMERAISDLGLSREEADQVREKYLDGLNGKSPALPENQDNGVEGGKKGRRGAVNVKPDKGPKNEAEAEQKASQGQKSKPVGRLERLLWRAGRRQENQAPAAGMQIEAKNAAMTAGAAAAAIAAAGGAPISAAPSTVNMGGAISPATTEQARGRIAAARADVARAAVEEGVQNNGPRTLPMGPAVEAVAPAKDNVVALNANNNTDNPASTQRLPQRQPGSSRRGASRRPAGVVTGRKSGGYHARLRQADQPRASRSGAALSVVPVTQPLVVSAPSTAPLPTLTEEDQAATKRFNRYAEPKPAEPTTSKPALVDTGALPPANPKALDNIFGLASQRTRASTAPAVSATAAPVAKIEPEAATLRSSDLAQRGIGAAPASSGQRTLAFGAVAERPSVPEIQGPVSSQAIPTQVMPTRRRVLATAVAV